MGVELEDIVEKLQKQKKKEKKLQKSKEKAERDEWRAERKKLMKFTSSQRWKLSDSEQQQLWRIFKARRKSYYNYPRGVVYLSSIPHGFYEEQMISYFSQFGKVTGIYMPRGKSGKSRGYAFIEFQLEVIAKIVAETMNNYLFYQRVLKAKYVPPEKQKPYMFVFPYAEKRIKSKRIENERQRRENPSTEAQVEGYKLKVQHRIDAVQNKFNYTVQVTGDAPPVKETKLKVVKENKPVEKKLKEILKNEKKEKNKNLFDEQLTKSIKDKISKKLSNPIGAHMEKENSALDKISFSDDSESDFETAEEDNFMSFDGDDAFEDDDSMDTDEEQSPPKKMKFSKKSTPKSNKNSPLSKNSTPRVENKKISEIQKFISKSTPKSVLSKKLEDKTPKSSNKLNIKTPKSTVGKKLEDKTPKSSNLLDIKTPNSTVGKKLEDKTPKSSKKLDIKTPKSTVGKKLEDKTPKSSNKLDIKTPKSAVGKKLDIKTPKSAVNKKLEAPKSGNKKLNENNKKIKLNIMTPLEDVKEMKKHRKSLPNLENTKTNKIKTPKIKSVSSSVGSVAKKRKSLPL